MKTTCFVKYLQNANETELDEMAAWLHGAVRNLIVCFH